MRNSGVLLHITSLPSRGGIGTLGQAAYDFVDFVKASGKSFASMRNGITPPGASHSFSIDACPLFFIIHFPRKMCYDRHRRSKRSAF